MALQNKRSDTPGAMPNLVPGEIGINRSDERLWLRAEGRRIGVDTQAWKSRAAPADGVNGAPLARVRDAVDWSTEHLPSSVVDGQIAVDAPPVNSFGVPGFYPSALGAQAALAADDVLIEPFYVASDTILVTHMAFRCADGAASAVRVALVDADDVTRYDAMLLAPREGINELLLNTPLPRGHYRAVLWSLDGVRLDCVLGYRFEQGFEVTSGGLDFIVRQRLNADFSAGVDLAGQTPTPDTAPTPGELKALMLRWSL